MNGLSTSIIDPLALLAAVAHTEHGGTALFLGTTRREQGERSVTEIHYDAYEALARSELAVIAREVGARSSGLVVIQHRVGVVPVGCPSVGIAAGAPHRAEAFAACQDALEQIKSRVPIWKNILFEDGGRTWLDGRDYTVAASFSGR